jgi:hypothetical protein
VFVTTILQLSRKNDNAACRKAALLPKGRKSRIISAKAQPERMENIMSDQRIIPTNKESQECVKSVMKYLTEISGGGIV